MNLQFRHQRRHQGIHLCGQSLVEYTILLALVGLVLVIGEDSPMEVLFRAIQGYYGRFTFSMSMP